MDIEKLIGTTIEGRYRVLRQLDQGGTSHILLAYHEELDIHVVLKVLNTKAENNDNLHAHSVQEGRLLARLNHPNIVRIHDRFTSAQLDALVLEHIEGQNLARLSRGSPFAWNRACRLLLQCCAAVEALHEAGFLHRDLNPQNFMVQQGIGEADETIKLIDLGTAKHLSGQEPLADALELTTTITPCTPAYVSPEHARNELRGGSVAADTYGLAVTLFACVVGRPPWTTGALDLLLQQIGMEPAFIPENINMPPALRERPRPHHLTDRRAELGRGGEAPAGILVETPQDHMVAVAVVEVPGTITATTGLGGRAADWRGHYFSRGRPTAGLILMNTAILRRYVRTIALFHPLVVRHRLPAEAGLARGLRAVARRAGEPDAAARVGLAAVIPPAVVATLSIGCTRRRAAGVRRCVGRCCGRRRCGRRRCGRRRGRCS